MDAEATEMQSDAGLRVDGDSCLCRAVESMGTVPSHYLVNEELPARYIQLTSLSLAYGLAFQWSLLLGNCSSNSHHSTAVAIHVCEVIYVRNNSVYVIQSAFV